MSHASVRSRTLAASLSLALVLGGSLVATQAQPALADAAPVVTVTPNTDVDPTVDNTFTVSGTGFTGDGAANGVYVLLGSASTWTAGTPLPGAGWIAQTWVPSIVDGAFTTTITAPAASMDATGSYVIATSAAHGLSQTDRTLDTSTAITLAAPAPDPEPQPDPDPEPQPDPDPQPQPDPDPQPQPDPDPVPSEPTIAVSKTEGLSPAGETVTITGTGFAPHAPETTGTRPPLANQFGGAYVVFGKFPDNWKPSAGVSSSLRKVGTQKWVVEQSSLPSLGGQSSLGVPINSDGSFTLELTVAPGFSGEPATGNYGIYTYPGSGAAYAPFETYTPVSFAAPTATTTTLTSDPASSIPTGGSVTLTATVSPAAAGSVTFSDGETVLGTSPVASGIATIVAEGLSKSTHNFSAAFTPSNSLAWVGSTGTLVLPVGVPVPTISVSKTTGLTAGETITVTGTGFDPQPPATNGTRPPLANQFGGAYVVFGKFPDNWKPSAGVSSSQRKVGTQKWVVNPESIAALGAQSGLAVPITADGSFTLELTVTPGYAGEPETGNYGVYTYPGSGAAYAPFETYTPISFAPTPKVTVSKTAGLTSGETVTISGTGFTPQPPATNGTRPPLANQFGGAYVVFGKFPDNWKPSAGVSSSLRKVGAQKWVVNPESIPSLGAQSGLAVPLNPDGTFTLELTVSQGYAGEPELGNYGIYTYPGSGASYAPFETYTPISFAVSDTTTDLTAEPAVGLVDGQTTTLTATVSPASAAGTVTFSDGTTELGSVAVASGLASLETPGLASGTHQFTAVFTPTSALAYTGSTGQLAVEVSAPNLSNPLTWGVKQSFREYVEGPIAHGTITTAGAGRNGDRFVFGTSAGGTFDGATGVGTAKYAGSVRFQGHGGILDLTLSDPIVDVTSASSAVLLVSINGDPHVPFANLNLAAGTRSTTSSTLTWAGVPASLTEQGAGAFSLGGSPFYEVGSALDPVTFVISAVVPEPPKATTLSLGASPSTAVSGATVTLTATVAPANSGTVRFYDGSTLLGSRTVAAPGATASLSFTAGAAGTSTLRAEFAPSSTKYLPSTASVDYTVTAPPPPTVASGALRWGVKDSFRSYITGGIAKGTITTSGAGFEGGEFVFGQSTGGTFSAATGVGTSNYSGSVRFSGHDGLLELALSNPTVRVDSASSGVLLVSVNGSAPVAFATLDLSAGVRSTPGNAVAWSGVPATLTAAGSTAFSYQGATFYAPGTQLDPVTFIIGAPSSSGTSGGSSATIAAYAGERQPASTPPATEGLTVMNADKLVAGGEITVSGKGFESNEEDILVVLYSEPLVLARDATADAGGLATWTGRLPGDLTGKHTITLQGSINLGAEIEIAPRMTVAAAGCTVSDAQLSWGFKESFRSYISGSIANGEWTVADGATYETPLFGWSDGDGSYDAETAEGAVTFPGSITFTGHGGILNTTVSNPTLQFVDATTAILLLDVSGTTQEGEPVDERAVEFVELDLSGTSVLADDILTITDAPAVLLPAGAAAFGTYEAGEEFDPVSVQFALDPECASAAPTPEAEATAGAQQPVSTDASVPWWAWVLAALLVLAIIAAVIAIVLGRRRRA